MSSHVLLVYNEIRQKEIISAYNAVTQHLPADQRKQFQVDSTLPDETCKYNGISISYVWGKPIFVQLNSLNECF